VTRVINRVITRVITSVITIKSPVSENYFIVHAARAPARALIGGFSV